MKPTGFAFKMQTDESLGQPSQKRIVRNARGNQCVYQIKPDDVNYSRHPGKIKMGLPYGPKYMSFEEFEFWHSHLLDMLIGEQPVFLVEDVLDPEQAGSPWLRKRRLIHLQEGFARPPIEPHGNFFFQHKRTLSKFI